MLIGIHIYIYVFRDQQVYVSVNVVETRVIAWLFVALGKRWIRTEKRGVIIYYK